MERFIASTAHVSFAKEKKRMVVGHYQHHSPAQPSDSDVSSCCAVLQGVGVGGGGAVPASPLPSESYFS